MPFAAEIIMLCVSTPEDLMKGVITLQMWSLTRSGCEQGFQSLNLRWLVSLFVHLFFLFSLLILMSFSGCLNFASGVSWLLLPLLATVEIQTGFFLWATVSTDSYFGDFSQLSQGLCWSDIILDTCCCRSVVRIVWTLFETMACSTPGFPVFHQLLELAQTRVHWIRDAIQPFHPLSFPSPAFSLSQHQDLFQWVGSSHRLAKVWELQPEHQFLQWIFRMLKRELNSLHIAIAFWHLSC